MIFFLIFRVLLVNIKEKKMKMKIYLNHLYRSMNKRLDTLVSMLLPIFCSLTSCRICVGLFIYHYYYYYYSKWVLTNETSVK